ncbi:MAG: sucrose phosphorylase [Actinomycetaceae bacterium]|nr:sucrose phosphorylase [Actinomycetaceae bacterium]
MAQRTELICYADRFGSSLGDVNSLLTTCLDGVFDGVHLLPFYTPYDGADAGFDPADHTLVDPRLGSWADVRAIASHHGVMADMIVNHVSLESPRFADVLARGNDSPYSGMFLTFSSVFPNGATEEELAAIYRPRPGLPFTPYTWGREGENPSRRLVWTTFTPQQIDVDVTTPPGRAYLTEVLDALAAGGVTQVRLDAVGYARKRAGTSCFMTDDTYAFIDDMTAQARRRGMSVLVEIHSHYLNQVAVASRVDRVYDFALPPLVLHALYTGDPSPLCRWLDIRPTNAVTVLDTHDGIGIVDVGPDPATGAPGLLSSAELDALVEGIHAASGGASRQATGWAASNVDVYQVNCTFYDACGADPNAYFLARAIQAFTPGTMQVYYAGLLHARCDTELLSTTGIGRDINRPYYTAEEVRARLADPQVRRLIDLVRLRKTHPAFDGETSVSATGTSLEIVWTNSEAWARLEADFATRRARVTHSESN